MELDGFIDAGCANLELLEEQYAAYNRDPSSVDKSWHALFQKLDQAQPVAAEDRELEMGLLREAYRSYGHLMAAVNPIALSPPEVPPPLQLEARSYESLVEALKVTYCGKIGVEYMGAGPEIEQWIQQRIEPTHNQPQLNLAQKRMILEQLNKAELLELFLHTKYVGQKRFSLEGMETLIPMLFALIEAAGAIGVEEFVLGMAHRGRLNVLCNIFKKSYADVFAEFDEHYEPSFKEGSGDVKYHKGFFANFQTTNGQQVSLDLAPNPSHLESVDPVVEGLTRAKQALRGDRQRKRVIPLLIHGDAALTGQGVIYETLQLYKLPGYYTGGTLHIVLNNQIGFTTLPRDARSTPYCTDIARAFGMPIFHVNAEDPEGCVYVTLLALELRQKFHCDVFIDLNGYRKYGHNEGDEPAFTQPVTYQIIRKKKSIRQLYRDTLIQESVVEKEMAESLEEAFKKGLNEALNTSKLREAEGARDEEHPAPDPETGVDKKSLQEMAKRLSEPPQGFKLHPKILQLSKDRLEMVVGQKPLDWGMAETLAYASILWEGKSVRIAGQDCCRGTFSHRHALWIDQVDEKGYIPLQHLKDNQGRFEIYNSPLSENATLGFEFGYSVAAKESLVIWEAQFGDFSNGAQLVIDQFITPSEQKWGQISAVTLFLPHGYEGQGPEHSSARIERYLCLAGNYNMRIVNPTTPAQLFHLLRRQLYASTRKPLIVFTPKGLLRHPACVSELDELTKGHFQPVLDDPTAPKKVDRLVFCSGRLYYDLSAERAKRNAKEIALIRIEQLYPLAVEVIKEIIQRYKGFQACLWAQEEPENMGAWEFMRTSLPALLPEGCPFAYVGRSRSAATAVGSHALHNKQQLAIIEAVFKS